MKIEVKNSIKPVDYRKSMKILEKRVVDVLSGKKNELLWILEHKPVYTAGTSFKSEDLLDKKVNLIKTNRGGKITYHGPGQKVIYFVLNLNSRGKNIRKLINNIENCIIAILKEYNVNGFADRKNIGIWINHKNKIKKIAAIGLKVKRWIVYHGFSINISNDLSMYKKINPCGIKDKGISRLDLLSKLSYNDINKVISKKFLDTFLQE